MMMTSEVLPQINLSMEGKGSHEDYKMMMMMMILITPLGI